MATFITTLQFTEQGIKAVRDTCDRAAAFKATAKKLGVKVTGIYWTLGAFDGVIVCEAPDEETATAALLHLGSLGNIRTQTARAFDAAEKLGVKVTGQYWTLGAFDGVIVCEAPDEATATAVLLHLGSLGNIRTQTARAYNIAEMQKILGLLPG